MRWLHLSDIHYNPTIDGRGTSQLRDDLPAYLESKKIIVDEIFITGDFRYALFQKNDDLSEAAQKSVDFIKRIATSVGVSDVDHIHIVPGNHDLTRDNTLDLAKIVENYDCDQGDFEIDTLKSLQDRFDFFRSVEHELYRKNSHYDNSISDVHRYKQVGEHVILYMNTALTCGYNEERKNLLVGNRYLYKTLEEINNKYKGKDIIVLAHHGLDYFCDKERQVVENFLLKYPVSLYLCGDSHTVWCQRINKHVEITMGCVLQATGVEAAFCTGDTNNSIIAHQWNQKFSNWSSYGGFNKRIKELLPSPKGATSVTCINNLPHIRNTYFTGRECLLKSINKAFNDNKNHLSPQIITGTGGIGKTQIALEYAYRYKNEYKWICWISAETEATILSSCFLLAKKLKLDVDNDNEERGIIESVLNWLDKNHEWLLIYDNVDNISPDSYWYPQNTNGDIIITTRNRQIHMGKMRDVTVFSADESVAFLSSRTNCRDNKDMALTLSERLGFLPLAIEQAAAYIKNNDCSYAEYLTLLEKYGLEILEDTNGIIDYMKSVTVTWQISINKVADEAAKQLLYLCAYISPEGIEKTFFSENSGVLPSPLQKEISDILSANKIWQALTKYSLLEKKDEQTYSMHRLLQAVVRRDIDNDSQWAKYCLDIFYNSYIFALLPFSTGFEGIFEERFVSFMPHMEALAENGKSALTDPVSQEKLLKLCAECAHRSFYLGDYDQSLKWALIALDIRIELRGIKSQEVFDSQNSITNIYIDKGDYAAAIVWLVKLLKVRDGTFGKSDLFTIYICKDLSEVCLHQGDYSEALRWGMEALSRCEKSPDGEPNYTWLAYNTIAHVYENECNYNSALEWYEKEKQFNERIFWGNHEVTARTYSDIGGVYLKIGDYEQALSLNKATLEIRKDKLGDIHVDVAASCTNIATIYKEQGDPDKTLEWLRKALSIQEKAPSDNCFGIASTYYYIADILYANENLSEAVRMYEKALEILRGAPALYRSFAEKTSKQLAKVKEQLQ